MDLFEAIERGHEADVSRLLDADPNSLENLSHTEPWCRPLQYAALHGRLGMARLLVEREADIHATAELGRTALHWAAEAGHEEVVGLLLSHGAEASIMVRDEYGSCALTWAAAGGHLGVVKMLLPHIKGQGLDEADYERKAALLIAANRGHEEVVAFLLSQGATADIKDHMGWTPCMHAAAFGNLAMVKMLVAHMGEQGLDAQDEEGMTALHCAAQGPYEGVVRTLLLAGADRTITDGDGRTPLASASEHGHQGCVEVFEVSMPRSILSMHSIPVSLSACCHMWRLRDHRSHEPHEWCPPLCVCHQWWEGELERRYFLQRARCLHDVLREQQATPTAPVPVCLQERKATSQALPQVEVVARQQEEQPAGPSGQEGASIEAGSTEEEEEVHAVLAHVVGLLNEQLFTELMQCLHA
jgi:ankyrin repeat protein